MGKNDPCRAIGETKQRSGAQAPKPARGGPAPPPAGALQVLRGRSAARAGPSERPEVALVAMPDGSGVERPEAERRRRSAGIERGIRQLVARLREESRDGRVALGRAREEARGARAFVRRLEQDDHLVFGDDRAELFELCRDALGIAGALVVLEGRSLGGAQWEWLVRAFGELGQDMDWIQAERDADVRDAGRV